MAISTPSQIVNRIGFGTWQIGGETQFGQRHTGWGPVDEQQAIDAIHFAIDNGIHFFDTADGYGKGRSETILGKALKQRPGCNVKICTKVGSRWDSDNNTGPDFSAEWIKQAVIHCLRRLQTEHIDILLLHSPDINFDWADYDVSIFEKLMDKGLISEFGVSVKSVKAIPPVQSFNIGTIIEAIFNIFDRRLIPAISGDISGRKYIARVPLASGFLTDRFFSETPVFGPTDIRQYLSKGDVQWLVEHVRKLGFLRDLPGGIEVSALRFCISFEPIAFVIPGMYKIDHVKSALLAAELGPLPDDILRRIEQVITDMPDSWK